MNQEQRIEGLSLKVSPLGENDRLITLLTETEGVTRLAVPGARRPRSSLSAAAPLTYLQLQIGGRSSLKRVRQIKILRSFSNVGKQLETLAAAQAIAELIMILVPDNDPLPGMLSTVLMHLQNLEQLSDENTLNQKKVLAQSIHACVHLLALGGYGLPIQECCRSGSPLNPPIGDWDWRCSLLANEGFAIGAISLAEVQLNPSELALLQRLLRPTLPIGRDGNLMGPIEVWLKLLKVVENWIRHNLPKNVRSLKMLRDSLIVSGDRRI